MITSCPRWFIRAMSKALNLNCRKNEDNVPYRRFWEARLHEELDELIIELSKPKPYPQKVLEEAADLANIAMLTARWYGAEAWDRQQQIIKKKGK